MKTIKLTSFFMALLVACTTPQQPEKKSQKLKRSDCFFGVHFDLHASEDITDAGKTLTAEMIDTTNGIAQGSSPKVPVKMGLG